MSPNNFNTNANTVMETIPEKKEATSDALPPMERLGLDDDQKPKADDDDQEDAMTEAERALADRLQAKGVDLCFHTGGPPSAAASTESMGHRNVRAHRRVQSTSLFSILDAPSFTPLRARSMSMADAFPSLDKYYPGSHLVDYGSLDHATCLFLSLWLLPPMPLRKTLQQEIAKLAMRYNHHGSSAPFMPHITIVGSIRCETHRDAMELGQALQKGMKGLGGVPCRFSSAGSPLLQNNHQQDNGHSTQNNSDNPQNNSDNQQSSNDPQNKTLPNQCVAMYNNENTLVWSQSCIAIMERSEEYMKCLEQARALLKLPKGEWMFPGPACEPHCSTFYGKFEIKDQVPIPPDFVAEEAALYMTTPGTLEGVAKWREVARIPLL